MSEITLFQFAFCGTPRDFARALNHLALIAEDEKWSFDGRPNSLLSKYIHGTFKQCYAQNKILYSEKDGDIYACFNTGLMTDNGQDIVALFEKNERECAQEWRLIGFKDKSSRLYVSIFGDETPEIATYIENYEQLYFDPDSPIVINSDHILDDNWERIKAVVPLSKSVMKHLLSGVIDDAKKKVRRNMRLVIPQFYNNKVMYLLPIQFPVDEDKTETMALAIELTDNKLYRANTIFTKEMAYEKARLLMKPESNWLI